MKICFYRAEELSALTGKIKRARLALALIWAATLGLCLLFALRRNTLNAARMELYATAALILGGWVAIAVRDCAIRARLARREHAGRILAAAEAERELRGRVSVDKKRVSISRSIDVRGLRVETADGPVRLLIRDDCARALEKAAAQGEVTLRAREGYVTEVET